MWFLVDLLHGERESTRANGACKKRNPTLGLSKTQKLCESVAESETSTLKGTLCQRATMSSTSLRQSQQRTSDVPWKLATNVLISTTPLPYISAVQPVESQSSKIIKPSSRIKQPPRPVNQDQASNASFPIIKSSSETREIDSSIPVETQARSTQQYKASSENRDAPLKPPSTAHRQPLTRIPTPHLTKSNGNHHNKPPQKNAPLLLPPPPLEPLPRTPNHAPKPSLPLHHLDALSQPPLSAPPSQRRVRPLPRPNASRAMCPVSAFVAAE